MLFNFYVSSKSHVSVNLNGTSGLCEVIVTRICDNRSFSENLSDPEYDKIVECLKVREHDYAFDEAQIRFGYPCSENITDGIVWGNLSSNLG